MRPRQQHAENFKRRRGFPAPRFGLRALLALVTVVAAACGWLHSARQQRDRVALLARSNPSARIEYASSWFEASSDTLLGNLLAHPTSVTLHYPTSSDVDYLEQLPTLREIELVRSVDLGDSDVARLARLWRLERLTFLDGDQLTDQALAELGSLVRLERLQLSVSRHMTDSGLLALAKLGRLTDLALVLGAPPSSAAGGITAQGIDALRAELHNCRVRVIEADAEPGTLATAGQISWPR